MSDVQDGQSQPIAEHLDMLRRATRDMATTSELPVLLNSIVQALVDHTGAYIARVFLCLTDAECPTCQRRVGPSRFASNGERCLHLSASAGPGSGSDIDTFDHILPMDAVVHLTQVVTTREPLLTNNLQTVTRRTDDDLQHQILQDLGVTAAGAHPLVFRGQVLGAIGILSRTPFEPVAFELLQIFADHAATAITNARILDELSRYRAQLQTENAYLRDELESERGFEEVIGDSDALRSVLRSVAHVAAVETTILLTGETGTGKELIARAIHNLSARRSRTMIKMNCGAIPQGVVESELFGHEKGAFTGAVHRRIGRFELADRGTLFMDEVGELPLETQVKLLRVLQEQEFERVGSTQTRRVDVRLIAATNRDLHAEVAAARFRADLYYRLNVFPIRVPPLRERPGDIPLLIRHFLRQFQRKLGKPLRGITPQSLARLESYEWPGNIRELQNVIERACVLATRDTIDVSEAMDGLVDVVADTTTANDDDLVTLEEHERRHIRRALARTAGKIHGHDGAAELLGLNASTLRSRMERLGMSREDRDDA